MASGNQVITPDEGYSLSEVTVVKPSTLIPENIKKDVDIGGVVGTMESTGDAINAGEWEIIAYETPIQDVDFAFFDLSTGESFTATRAHISTRYDGSLMIICDVLFRDNEAYPFSTSGIAFLSYNEEYGTRTYFLTSPSAQALIHPVDALEVVTPCTGAIAAFLRLFGQERN